MNLRFQPPQRNQSVRRALTHSPQRNQTVRRAITYSPSRNRSEEGGFKRSKANRTLCLHHRQKQEMHFLVPYYMRLKIKDVSSVSYRESSAVINATLIFNIDVTDLPDLVVKQIRRKLVLQVNRCEQIEIRKSNEIEISAQTERRDGARDLRHLKVTVRKSFGAGVEMQYSNIFYSPYEELAIIATFTLNNISCEGGGKKIKISFNSMAFSLNPDPDFSADLRALLREIEMEDVVENVVENVKVKDVVEGRALIFEEMFLKDKHSHSLQLYLKSIRLEFDKATSGDYQFSTMKFGVEDSNKGFHQHHASTCLWKEREEKGGGKGDEKALRDLRLSCYEASELKSRSKAFKDYHQHTHFCFTLYKSPFPDILTILLPNIFLGFISFYIFYLKVNLIERTNLVATLLLGFIQLIPSIKAQLIDSNKITLLEIFTIISTCLCFVSFYDSFTRQHPPSFQEQSSERYFFSQLWLENPWFTICLIINIGVLLAILYSFGYYFYYKQVSLNEPWSYRKSKMGKLDRFIWKTYRKTKGILQSFGYLVKKNSVSKKVRQLRNFHDLEILKFYFKIPEHFQQAYSKYWSNGPLNKLLEAHSEFIQQSKIQLEQLLRS